MDRSPTFFVNLQIPFDRVEKVGDLNLNSNRRGAALPPSFTPDQSDYQTVILCPTPTKQLLITDPSRQVPH
jgi:hypothetical protein